MSRVLVTGANGFIGSQLCEKLSNKYLLRIVVRNSCDKRPAHIEVFKIDNIGPDTHWGDYLNNVDTIVHLAARVHIVRENSISPLESFRLTNVEGTRQLAQSAAKAGVKRFIFISTIKVNGEITPLGHAFSEKDIPNPQDPYGRSKMEAEGILRAIAEASGMEVVIIRPPLVYGPGVKANFHFLLCAVAHRVPLPLNSIHNSRSFVSVSNLADFIIHCIQDPAAANQTFLVSDGEDLSTPDLIRRMACAINRPARLFSVPPKLLLASASLLGEREEAQRLCSSLQVDISKARDLLKWRPPICVNEGLTSVARWYLHGKRNS